MTLLILALGRTGRPPPPTHRPVRISLRTRSPECTPASGFFFSSPETHRGGTCHLLKPWFFDVLTAPPTVGPDLEMRAHLAAIFSLAAIPSLIMPARSDEIPNLDVAQLCRGIVSQAKDPMAGGEPTVTFERCMNAEQADRKELEKVWPTFSADDKKHCVAESRMGGELSYTELITCLEMALAVRSYRTDGRQKDASIAQRRPPVTKARQTRSWSKRATFRHRHRWWCPPRRWLT